MSTEASKQQTTFARIHRLADGAVLGAVVWIPGFFIEGHLQPGQEMIKISFESDFIRIGKETIYNDV